MDSGIDNEIDPLEDERDQARNFDVGAGAGPKIARPNAVSALPAANLRGLPPPTNSTPAAPATTPIAPAAPAIGSVEDLEAKGLSSRIAPPRVAAPSAFDQHLASDEAQRANLDKGSGIDQFSQRHHILGPILRGLSVAGSIVAPAAMALTPGTDLHHNLLRVQNNRAIATDLGEQKTTADTGEAQARSDQAEAAAEKDRAAAGAGAPKPKEESWKEYPQFTDVDGAPLKIEANSGQVMRADGKPPTGFKAAKVSAAKTDTPEQQFIDEFQKTHANASVAEAVTAYANATHQPDKPQRQLAVINGKVVELKPGMDATGAQSIGGEEKAGAAGQSAKDALSYANDYMTQGQFTGAGDEALMEKYFELAKPSSGFRMTQAQIEMLQKARDLMGGLEAKAKHLFTPEAPYFSDEQRKQIVATMGELQGAKGGGGGAPHATAKDYGDAAGKPNGTTGTLPDGTKVVVKAGRIVGQ